MKTYKIKIVIDEEGNPPINLDSLTDDLITFFEARDITFASTAEVEKAEPELKVEVNPTFVPAKSSFHLGQSLVMITPPIDENYWMFRVPLSKDQAIVAFPKFGTIGVGFQREDDDWNTNLPFTCSPEELYNHIKCNKGDDAISDDTCLEAIKLLQKAIEEYQNGSK